MIEGKPDLEQHANWKAPKPEEGRKQYAPGEIADMEISRAAHDANTDRQRERLGRDYDTDTVRIVAEAREEKGDEAAGIVQARREANRDRDAEETIQMWARHEAEYDLEEREKDRKRIKPKDKAQALGAIDKLWGDINRALTYKPEHPNESIIDKDWGEAMLKILSDLEGQIKFEGSFPGRVLDKEELKTVGRKKWIEIEWRNKVEALRRAIAYGGDVYTETPAEEKQRRAARDQAIADEVRRKI